MEERLVNHIDILFDSMPQSENTNEIKEEILQNSIDKYYDLVNEGNDAETAYSKTVASIGDIYGLFANSRNDIDKKIEKQRKKSALLVSISVIMYICSIIPCIIFSEVGLELLAVSLMFAMIAVATGLLIYNGMTKYKPVAQETMVNDFKQWQSGKPSDKQMKSQVSGIIWSIIFILYFVISFATGAWYVTWVLFLVGIAAEQIARLCISLKKENGKEKEKSEWIQQEE